jgi:hypothetical protein
MADAQADLICYYRDVHCCIRLTVEATAAGSCGVSGIYLRRRGGAAQRRGGVVAGVRRRHRQHRHAANPSWRYGHVAAGRCALPLHVSPRQCWLSSHAGRAASRRAELWSDDRQCVATQQLRQPATNARQQVFSSCYIIETLPPHECSSRPDVITASNFACAQ